MMPYQQEQSLVTLSDRDGISLHTAFSWTVQADTSPTLILLHFAGGSNKTWQPLMAELQESFNIMAPSLRGWGRSDKPPFGYSIQDYAEDIVALISHVRTQHPELVSNGVLIVGHSMGGKIAQVILSKPELRDILKGLVLVGPAPAGSTQLQTPEMREQQLQAYCDFGAARLAVQYALLGRPDAVPEKKIDALAADISGGGEEAKQAWPEYGIGEDYRAVVEEAVRAHWHDVGLPVLVLTGSLDRVESTDRIQREVVNFLNAAGAHVSIIELANLGHLMMVEDPVSVAEIIRGFHRREILCL